MKEKIMKEKFQMLTDELIIKYAEKSTSRIWHQMAMEWNESSIFLKWIADNPKADKATALMLYWQSAPRYYKQFQDRDDLLQKKPYEIEGFEIVEKIEKNYTNGFYENQKFEYNPKNDQQGYDWTSEYLEIQTVREIPEIMFKELSGEYVEEPKGFIEGMPPELNEQYDELFEKYDID